MLTKLDQFHPEKASFKGWLFIIVRNRCYDHRRQDKTALNEEISRKTVDTLEEELDTNELTKPTVEILMELMEQINGEEKRLLMLKYHHGYSLRDIQQALGLSESCVKNRLFRVRQKLQKLLDKYRERQAV